MKKTIFINGTVLIWNQNELDQIMEEVNDDGRPPLSNSHPTTLDDLVPNNMDAKTQDNQQEIQRASGSAGPIGAGSVSKETPISPAQPSYGLQETHTTILPFNS